MSSFRTLLLVVLGLAAVLAGQEPAPTEWETLEAKGAVLGEIRLLLGEVFDLRKPEEAHWVGRLANALHPTTRERVVRRELDFKEGERVSARRIHESERRLRAFRFLKDARIWPEPMPDGRIRAVVETQDAWSLKASLEFNRIGGQNAFGFGLKEVNILGAGKALTLEWNKDSDRTNTLVQFQDFQVLGSAWTLLGVYQRRSDGKARQFALNRPFRGLDDPWAADVQAADQASVVSLYQHGQVAYEVPVNEKTAAAGFAWVIGRYDAIVQRLRLGLDYRQVRYGTPQAPRPDLLPAPRLEEQRLVGPSLSLSLFQDGFRTYHDLAGLTHTEDYNLGWDLRLAAGWYLRSLGSDLNAPFLRMSLGKGWAPGNSLLLLRVSGEGYRETGEMRDGQLNASLTWYGPVGKHFGSAARVDFDAMQDGGPQDVLYLGGLEGFRGYPNHFLVGDRRWIASFEERALTDLRFWGLFRLGFAAFADVGAIRNLKPGAWSRTYADLGGGLRVGDLKSSLGRVVYIYLARPLVWEPGQDRWQLLFGNIVRF